MLRWSYKTGLLLLTSLVISHAANGFEKKVLLIHSYHSELSWTLALKTGINHAFHNSEHQIEVFHEYLDAKRYPSLPHQRVFLDYIRNKFRSINLDLLMVSDDAALNLVMENELLEQLPVVYLGVNQARQEILDATRMTGVFENHDIEETIAVSLRQTESDSLVILTDTSKSGTSNMAKVTASKSLLDIPEVVIVHDLVSTDIEDTFSDIPAEWPVMILGQLRLKSASGPMVAYEESASLLRRHIANPMFSESTMHLGYGVVGGKMLDGNHHAQDAVKLALQVLEGTPVEEVKPILESKNLWMFDAREMKRFGYTQDQLPEGSVISYQQKTFYERNKPVIWATSAVLSIALIIIALLMEILRRRTIATTLLMENKKRYKDLAEIGADIFWEVDADFRVTHLSGDLPFNLELPAILGRSFKTLYRVMPYAEFEYAEVEDLFNHRKPITDLVYKVPPNNGRMQVFKISGRPFYDHAGAFLGYRGNQRQVTTEYELHRQLEYQAHHDELSNLINRRYFDTHLIKALDAVKRTNSESVLCYLDLDQFKVVNDTAGHSAGDRMLAEIAQLLKKHISPELVLGRLGGDEFGLIIENCSHLNGKEICEELIERVTSYRFIWGKRWFSVGVSIGIVPITSDSASATELLSKADMACYRAKDLGRNRVYLATEHDQNLASQLDEMNWLADISRALEDGRFYLAKQIIEPAKANNTQEHVEILLRLRGDKGENISPARFIPAAERYGSITQIDHWVVTTVAQQYHHLFPDTSPMISINLSGASLSDDRFLEYIKTVITRSEIDPRRLCFEITETAAITFISHVEAFIRQLKTIGIKFALDDFGSGVTSFSYLRKLPVDYLKIDGSLIRPIESGETNDLAIVEMINRLAHTMGIQTIAEYVETAKIKSLLQTVGVDFLQGYEIHKPSALPPPQLRNSSRS